MLLFSASRWAVGAVSGGCVAYLSYVGLLQHWWWPARFLGAMFGCGIGAVVAQLLHILMTARETRLFYNLLAPVGIMALSIGLTIKARHTILRQEAAQSRSVPTNAVLAQRWREERGWDPPNAEIEELRVCVTAASGGPGGHDPPTYVAVSQKCATALEKKWAQSWSILFAEDWMADCIKTLPATVTSQTKQARCKCVLAEAQKLFKDPQAWGAVIEAPEGERSATANASYNDFVENVSKTCAQLL